MILFVHASIRLYHRRVCVVDAYLMKVSEPWIQYFLQIVGQQMMCRLALEEYGRWKKQKNIDVSECYAINNYKRLALFSHAHNWFFLYDG